MTKNDILFFLQEHRVELLNKYGVQKIGLFGSYTKDMATDESDIDIVIDLKKKDFFIREEIREYLENHFKKSVDIGYLDSFRGFYRQQIEKEIIYV